MMKKLLLFRKILVVLLTTILIAVGNSGWAQITKTFIPTGNGGIWNSTTNWSPNGLPTASDNVLIPKGKDVSLSISDAVCASIIIGDGNGGSTVFTFNVSSAKLTVTNGVTLGNGGALVMTSGGTLNCGSLNLLNSGQSFTPGTGTVELTGTNTIPNTIFTTFNNLTINGGTTSIGANKTINGNLSISSGTLDLGAFTANRATSGGSLTVSDGATLQIGGTGTMPSNYTTHSIGNTSTVEYKGSNQTVAVPNSGQSYGNLSLSGSGTKTVGGAISVATSASVSSGVILTIPASTTLTINGNLTNSGAIQGTGTIAKSSGTYTGNNPSNINPGTSPGILTITGGLDLGFSTFNCEINGVTEGTQYDQLRVSGTATITSAILNVTWGYTPDIGASFTLLTTGSANTSDFSSVIIQPVTNRTFGYGFEGSNYVLRVLGPLPIELVNFKATKQAKSVILDWKTASEVNNEKFLIERSSDGQKYISIGEVSGHGTTTEPQSYHFMDERPAAGINYYRLKQMDYDGGFEYSPIQSVVFRKAGEILVYPTITTGELQVVLPSESSDKTTLTVYSLQGALLSEQVLDGNGINYTVTLPEMPSGQYIVEVKSGALSSKTRIFKG